MPSSNSLKTLLEKCHHLALPLLHPPEIALFSTSTSRRLRIRYHDQAVKIALDVYNPAESLLAEHMERIVPSFRTGCRGAGAVGGDWSRFRGRGLEAAENALVESGSWEKEFRTLVEMQVLVIILNDWDRACREFSNYELLQLSSSLIGTLNLVTLISWVLTDRWFYFEVASWRHETLADKWYPFFYKLFNPRWRRWVAAPSSSHMSSEMEEQLYSIAEEIGSEWLGEGEAEMGGKGRRMG